jgi:hypothetical protein
VASLGWMRVLVHEVIAAAIEAEAEVVHGAIRCARRCSATSKQPATPLTGIPPV